MGASKWFFSMSGVILLIGALAIGGKGLNFGIDFTSGTRITDRAGAARERERRSARCCRRTASTTRRSSASTTRSSATNVFQISTERCSRPGPDGQERDSTQRFGGTANFSSTSVGPTFGQTVANNAIIAIIASLLVISAYIALRFEWKFAVPVLIALMHDLLITGGVYSLTGREVTSATVAALLTILGYSLYDTIIVFDRIRENMPRMPRAAFSQIVEPLDVRGADALARDVVLARCCRSSRCCCSAARRCSDFAFALLVGVISGAYSSIFIASPVLTALEGARAGLRGAAARGSPPRTAASCRAYAVATAGGDPVDVEPEAKRRSLRAGASRRRTSRASCPRRSSTRCAATSTSDDDGRDRSRRAAVVPRPSCRRPSSTRRAGRPRRRRRGRRPSPRATAARRTKPRTTAWCASRASRRRRGRPRNRRHGRPR